MKNLIRLSIVLTSLFLLSPAWATLSVGNCSSSNGSANPQTLTLGASVASNSVIFVYVGNGYNSYSTMSVSDGTSGTYNAGYKFQWTGAYASATYWVHTTASYTPTISVTNSSGDFLAVTACVITGWTGTPTLDTSIGNHFTAASTTAVSISPITSSQNNELLIVGFTGGSDDNWTTTPPNWSIQTGSSTGTTEQITAFEATSGTTNNLSGTLTTSQTWYALVTGLYDATGGSSCTNAGWNLATRTFTVPTAGSGSFWHSTGVGGSVDCSTAAYWQSTRTFGTN